ncbi:GyrI-like domain-containing protein [Devosia sp. A16]|uniref:GyrI-like domain-containing protein n=1 Tax=Devosia sp. A16 TaxID=1736675 RepID=UPI0006D77934|nr:GyrI-like domain-containing protein [Devosia sp. A16]
MLTLPVIVERAEQPYVAIRRRVTIPFGEAIGPIMGQLFGAIDSQSIQASGPVFFKYNIVAMPELEIEFAVPTATKLPVASPLLSGVLPAGRYAQLTYWGHYDNLIEANAVLIGWARHKGIAWDATEAPDGDHFAARVEIYPNGPDDEPDPDKWETTVAIKVRD